MSAGLFSGEPTGDPTGVPCDPEQWSEDSKRSVACQFAPRPYRDKGYLCWRCSAREVFTATEQKYTFEVRKANISQSRCLCRACYREWVKLMNEARVCRQRWVTEGRMLRRDLLFLQRWLVVLETLSGYNPRRDEGNIVMLRRLVAEQSQAELGADVVPPKAAGC